MLFLSHFFIYFIYIYPIPFILHEFFHCKDILINYLSTTKRKPFY